MSDRNVDVARALRDPEYRESLTEEERALLPEHPAGQADLSDADLETVSGGLAEPLEAGTTGTGTGSRTTGAACACECNCNC